MKSQGFLGWSMVAIGFTANFLASVCQTYGWNAFTEPLGALRSWSRTEINMAMSIGFLLGGCMLIPIGRLIMAAGIRRTMLGGALTCGAGLIWMGLTSSLWCFYLAYSLAFGGALAFSFLTVTTLTTNWFDRRRGLALGTVSLGSATAGFVGPSILAPLIDAWGVPLAFLTLGALVAAAGLLFYLTVVDAPPDEAMPLGGVSSVHTNPHDLPPASEEHFWTFRSLVRLPSFHLTGLAFGLGLLGTTTIMSQLKPILVSRGFTDSRALLILGLTALVGGAGKLFWGSLCDRFRPRQVAATVFFLSFLGLGCGFCAHRSLVATAAFVIVFGSSMGGQITIFAALTADYFGRRSFTNASRFLSIYMLLQIAGFPLAGWSYDRFQSYTPALLVFAGAYFMAFLLILASRRPVFADPESSAPVTAVRVTPHTCGQNQPGCGDQTTF